MKKKQEKKNLQDKHSSSKFINVVFISLTESLCMYTWTVSILTFDSLLPRELAELQCVILSIVIPISFFLDA